MRLPKRAPEHVTETASWKLFDPAVPPEWMVREVTERDYGIDCYLEFTKDGNVTGDLTSIQLKGNDGLKWTKKEGVEESTFSGVKVETINYWMRVPVPVFLVVADIKNKEVYFVNVKAQVRERFDEFRKQDTMSFYLNRGLRLDAPGGPAKLVALYEREIKYRGFAAVLVARLGEFHEDLDFIYGKQGYDEFMEVEEGEYFRIRALLRGTRHLADVLGIDWTVPDLQEMAKEGRSRYGGHRTSFHYGSLDKVLVALEPKYFEVMEAAKKFVTETERQFWHDVDYYLFEYCLNLDVKSQRRKA